MLPAFSGGLRASRIKIYRGNDNTVLGERVASLGGFGTRKISSLLARDGRFGVLGSSKNYRGGNRIMVMLTRKKGTPKAARPARRKHKKKEQPFL